MKHSLKKVVSVMLAVLMLVSLCTAALVAEAAEKPGWDSFGVIEGTGAYADGSNIVEFEGEWVIQMPGGKSNYNLKLADPDDPTTALTMTAGTIYTVRFDYWLQEAVSFSIRPMKHPTASGQRGDALDTVKSGISNTFVGDGKWHTGSLTFTAVTPTGGGETLDNLGFLFQNVDTTKGAAGYLRNIEVIEETGAADLYGSSDIDMTLHADHNLWSRFGSGMSSSYLSDDDNLVLVSSHEASLAAGQASFCQSRAFLTDKDTAYAFKSDVQYRITFRYKVVAGATTDYGGYVGVGYQKNGNCDTGTATYVADVSSKIAKGTTTNGDWLMYDAVITPTYDADVTTGYVRLIVEGKGLAVEIADVTICYSGMDSASLIQYNDNGVISVGAQYEGTDILAVGANAYDNEEFIGWCTDAQLTTEVTKAPETDGTLYAKYPSVVIDFNNFKGFHLEYGLHGSCSAGMSTTDAGVYNVKFTNNVGMMYPSYDADLDDRKDADVYYKFTDGVTYRITYVYKADLTASFTQTLATHAGGQGDRNIASDSAHAKPTLTAATEWDTVSVNITAKTAEGYDNMCMRPQSGNNPTVNFDKIIITDVSLIDMVDMEMVQVGSIREEKAAADNNGVYQSAGVRYKGRVSASYRETTDEIGFVAVPTAVLGEMTFEEYLALADNKAVSAKVKAEDMDEIVYDTTTDIYGREYYDYQLIITGLTVEGKTENLLDTEISVAVYAVADGETTYAEPISYSYQTIADIMAEMGQ